MLRAIRIENRIRAGRILHVANADGIVGRDTMTQLVQGAEIEVRAGASATKRRLVWTDVRYLNKCRSGSCK